MLIFMYSNLINYLFYKNNGKSANWLFKKKSYRRRWPVVQFLYIHLLTCHLISLIYEVINKCFYQNVPCHWLWIDTGWNRFWLSCFVKLRTLHSLVMMTLWFCFCVCFSLKETKIKCCLNVSFLSCLSQ